MTKQEIEVINRALNRLEQDLIEIINRHMNSFEESMIGSVQELRELAEELKSE